MEDVSVVKPEKVTSTDPSTAEGGKNVEKESGADEEAQTTIVTKKGKIRKRKKALHTAIRNQMEFYFSDANLSKDRFMQTVIKDGPEISLDVFMNFNKLRTLTEDVKEIAKALKFSTTLKLSEDGTKVSRITPFRPKSQEEVDLCTIYVEHLPPHATIEWITNVFSEFGTVAYVSLPKFKDGFRIKGFAFVEFNDSESSTKAVKAYAASNAFAALTDDPGQLQSIQAFNEESRVEDDHKTVEIKNAPSPKTDKNEEADDNAEPKSKRQKVDAEASSVEEELAEKKADSDLIETETEANSAAPKKKRKQNSNFSDEINQEAQTLSLQVISKKEWKKLRNKYLDMQRKCLRQIRINSRRQHAIDNPTELAVEEKKERIPEETKTEANLDFEPGLIVKISLDEPISDAKRFKSQVKCQDGVTYVEAQDCSTTAFVRCTDGSVAQSLVAKKIWNHSEILQGEEERDYWRKIEENRIKKRDKTSRPKKSGAERARQKKENIIDADQPGYPTRAVQHKNLHIRFDDAQEDNND